MTVSDKIRAQIKLKRGSYKELAGHMGIPTQTLHNKLSRNSFYAADLTRIADFFGIELAFIEDSKPLIAMDASDVPSKEKKDNQ